MDAPDLRHGRLVLLGAVVAFLVGAAVQAVRTVPDPDLFSSTTGTIISLALTALTIVPLVRRPPSWLTHDRSSGNTH